MPVSVKVVGLEEVKSLVAGLGREAPYAAIVMLNNLAFGSQSFLTGTMVAYMDRPTPFTLKGLGVQKASKATLQSKVFVRPIQSVYLQYQIEGGVRTPAGQALVIPTGRAKLNVYGNMPSGYVQKLLATPGVFSGTVRGVPGIYQRWTETWRAGGTVNIGSGHLQLLVAYEPKARYAPRWPMLTKGIEWSRVNWKTEGEKAINWVLSKA